MDAITEHLNCANQTMANMKISLLVLLIACVIFTSKTEADEGGNTLLHPDGAGQDAVTQPGAEANKYQRGCSKLQQCRDDTTSGGPPN
jgi:Rapid ALkalinization Factor (RALF)